MATALHPRLHSTSTSHTPASSSQLSCLPLATAADRRTVLNTTSYLHPKLVLSGEASSAVKDAVEGMSSLITAEAQLDDNAATSRSPAFAQPTSAIRKQRAFGEPDEHRTASSHSTRGAGLRFAGASMLAQSTGKLPVDSPKLAARSPALLQSDVRQAAGRVARLLARLNAMDRLANGPSEAERAATVAARSPSGASRFSRAAAATPVRRGEPLTPTGTAGSLVQGVAREMSSAQRSGALPAVAKAMSSLRDVAMAMLYTSKQSEDLREDFVSAMNDRVRQGQSEAKLLTSELTRLRAARTNDLSAINQTITQLARTIDDLKTQRREARADIESQTARLHTQLSDAHEAKVTALQRKRDELRARVEHAGIEGANRQNLARKRRDQLKNALGTTLVDPYDDAMDLREKQRSAWIAIRDDTARRLAALRACMEQVATSDAAAEAAAEAEKLEAAQKAACERIRVGNAARTVQRFWRTLLITKFLGRHRRKQSRRRGRRTAGRGRRK